MDIVEVDGTPSAKRGKLGGRKQVWRCNNCLIDHVLPAEKQAPKCRVCRSKAEPMLKPLILGGEIVGELYSPTKIRGRVLEQLEKYHYKI
jgi:nicotinate phosphoribosyltransferase